MIKIITTSDLACFGSFLPKGVVQEIDDCNVVPGGYLTKCRHFIPSDCCKVLSEPKFKVGDIVRHVPDYETLFTTFEVLKNNYDILLGYSCQLEVKTCKWDFCIGNKTLALENQLEKVKPEFKVGDRVKYIGEAVDSLCGNIHVRKCDVGEIYGIDEGYILLVDFGNMNYVECREDELEKIEPEPKFEFGMNLKVTHNISNSLVGLVGVVKGRKHQNGRYQYMMDFRKINSWRDLTWVEEDELEIYYEKPVKTELPIVEFHIWDWLKGKHKFKSKETFDEISENDKDGLERFYNNSRIIDEHIIKDNCAEEKKYLCPKHSDCVVARHCKRAIPHKHIKSDDFVCGKCPICIEFKKGENKMEENKLDNLKKKFKELGTEIEKLEKAEKNEDYTLRLMVGWNNELMIGFHTGDRRVWWRIGTIFSNGKCQILNDDFSIEQYEIWREKGMKVCSDKVEWRGKEYYIDSHFALRASSFYGCIYDFDRCEYGVCGDGNIVRFKHNNKPIGF